MYRSFIKVNQDKLRDSVFQGPSTTFKPREVTVMGTRATEHIIPQWAANLHSLRHQTSFQRKNM